ncbi:MAG: hypothetical protein HY716_06740 [Planctomycetes bacterium]|nr:hypothetical protein [Planctomycetota bacterium]
MTQISEELKNELSMKLSSVAQVFRMSPRTLLEILEDKSRVDRDLPDVLVSGPGQDVSILPRIIDRLKFFNARTRVIFYASEAAPEAEDVAEAGVHYYACGVSVEALADAVRVMLRDSSANKQQGGLTL